MHAWRNEARTMHDALSGRSAFNAAGISAALQSYVADAGSMQARIDPRSARARDIRARFAAFQADAQTALRDVQQRPALAADVSRLMNDCQSCPHRYKG